MLAAGAHEGDHSPFVSRDKQIRDTHIFCNQWLDGSAIRRREKVVTGVHGSAPDFEQPVGVRRVALPDLYQGFSSSARSKTRSNIPAFRRFVFWL